VDALYVTTYAMKKLLADAIYTNCIVLPPIFFIYFLILKKMDLILVIFLYSLRLEENEFHVCAGVALWLYDARSPSNWD
jgi:hypothetical protein